MVLTTAIRIIVLKAVKVRIYPTPGQQSHLAGAFGCVRWVWNQSLATMSQTYKETGKGVSALTMKKQIPVWKTEHEWLKECYSQCLQSSVLNLSQAFINFFDGRAQYPNFKKRQGRQSMQYPQNVKILSDSEIKFPGNLGVVKAKIHRDCIGTLRTVTVSRMPDGRYYASLLMDDGVENPVAKEEGKAIHLCSNTLLLLPKMDLSVREFDCPYCNQRHDRDINAAINIKNEGLRILALGTSVTASGGNVRPKQYGRKSTAVAAVALEGRSPHHTACG